MVLRIYKFLLQGALKIKYVLFAMVLVLFCCACFMLRSIGTEFIPALEEGTIVVTVNMAPSISLEEAQKTIYNLSQEIESIANTDMVISRIGRPEAGSHPHPINYSEIQVTLKDKSFTAKSDVVDTIRHRLNNYPGVQINISQPIQNEFDELLSGVKAQLAIKVYGEELDIIKTTAENISGVIKNVPGLTDLSVEQSFGQPQINVIVNHEACSRYGVESERVLKKVETAIGGKVIGNLYDNMRRYDIYIRYKEQYRMSQEALRQIFIRTDSGGLVPLDELAFIEESEGSLQINRENNQRRWIVQANIKDRALSKVFEDIKSAVGGLTIPPEVFIEYDGQFKQQQQAMKRFQIIVPIVIFLIVLLLWLAFNKFRYAMIIVLNVPLALIGGVIGLILTHQYLSIPASIGFIALFGIAIQDAMVMLTDFQDLRKEGQKLKDAVINGSLIRFRPVVMTTLTTLFGLFPLLVSNSPGAEIQRPLAVTVIFGLATSTLLTLFILPSMYMCVEQRKGDSI